MPIDRDVTVWYPVFAPVDAAAEEGFGPAAPQRKEKESVHMKNIGKTLLAALLALDVKNIRIGPSLPAFISPNILNVLVEKWHLTPISTADEDLKAILG